MCIRDRTLHDCNSPTPDAPQDTEYSTDYESEVTASTTPPVATLPATVDPEPDPSIQSEEDPDPSDNDTLTALSDTASEFGTHIYEPRPTEKPKSHSRVTYHHACSVQGPTDCHDFSLEVPLDDDEDCPLKDGQCHTAKIGGFSSHDSLADTCDV